MTEFRNEHEFRVFSLSRSGSHAIVNWIASMCDEPVYYFNHGASDPFRTRHTRGDEATPLKIKNFVQLPKMKRWSDEKILPIRLQKKRWLMYEYENFSLTRLKGEDKDYPILNRTEILGSSKNVYDVLILRDVYNFMASLLFWKSARIDLNILANFVHKINPPDEKRWLKDAKDICKRTYKEHFLRRWITYAQEFLRHTNYLQNKKICISFNHWFLDEDYRKQVAKLLNLEYSDFTLDFAGSPSSFDGKNYLKGAAQKIKALERWKTFKDNQIYWELLQRRPEAFELSKEIFGDILKQ